jgi:uncharacterized protein (TIGR02588 family)
VRAADDDRRPSTPPLELALGILGALVVLGLAGFLLLAALRGEGRGQPAIVVELRAAEQVAPGSWVVPFEASNRGPAPATQLTLEAELVGSAGERQRSEVVIDYLASGASQEGGFLFAADPAEGALTARPLGYLQP